MRFKFFLIILVVFLTIKSSEKNKLNIGLCVTATHKYITFIEPLLKSARKYFLKDHHVKYFVFTDREFANQAEDTIVIYQKHNQWPFSTMQRFEAYFNSREYFSDLDYIFAIDADMLFLEEIGNEILSKRVVVRHPMFWNNEDQGKEQYEDDPKSVAYVDKKDRKYYFQGCFYGGTKDEFLKMVETNAKNLKIDLLNKYIAKWHDESHLNKYYIDNPPTLILSPSYAYPQNYYKWIKGPFPFEKKILAIDKNYDMRA